MTSATLSSAPALADLALRAPLARPAARPSREVTAILPVDSLPTSLRARRMETRIRVEEGVVYVVADEDERVLTPGDETTVPADVAFRFWNAGDEVARVTHE